MLINDREWNVIDTEVEIADANYTRFARTAEEYRHLTRAYFCHAYIVMLLQQETPEELAKESAELGKYKELVFDFLGITHYGVPVTVKGGKPFIDAQTGKHSQRVEIKLQVYKKEGAEKSALPNEGTLPAKPIFNTNISAARTSLQYSTEEKTITLQGSFKAGDVVVVDTYAAVVKVNGVTDMTVVTINSDLETFEIAEGSPSITMPPGTTIKYKERFI